MSVKITIIALLALVCVKTVYCSTNDYNLVEEQIQEFQESLEELDNDFKELSEQFFWKRQQVADNQILRKDQRSSSYALKKVSSLYMRILCNQYAIAHKTIEMTIKILRDRFGSRDEGSHTDSKLRLDLDEIELLGNRAALRILIDGSRFSGSKWRELHKLLVHYAGANSTPELRSIATDIYLDSEEKGSVALEKLDTIESYLSTRGEDADATLLEIDRILEEAMSSEQNGPVKRALNDSDDDSDNLNLKPMFSNENEVEKLVERYVAGHLLEALRDSDVATEGHVLEFTTEEINSISNDEINGRRESFLISAGLM